jgi:hypothetical protein
VAARLNLTHFVDDKVANLETVRANVGCECLLFLQDGVGGQELAASRSGSVAFRVVPDWDHLLQILLVQ